MDEEVEVDVEVERVWEGKGEKLHAALEDAWERAKKDQAPPGTYVVTNIVIETENPIRGYIVVIAPGG
jgi:hypothetical protein